MKTNADVEIGSFNTSAASQNVGKSPYIRYPERESYKDYRFFRRPDGTRYVKIIDVCRWGGIYDNFVAETKDLADGEFPKYV